MSTENLSGIILAGGLSRRLGRNKAIENIENKPLLSIVYDSIKPFVNELIIVVNNKQRQEELSFLKNAKFTIDKFNNSGSLGGIYTGLLKDNNLKISNIFNMCKTEIISEKEIFETEPCTKSFFNINNEMDLTKAKNLINKYD